MTAMCPDCGLPHASPGCAVPGGTNDCEYEPGSVVRLKGKTQRGKNRINRGGELFEVVEYSDGYGYFLRSVDKGARECFWAWLPNDVHVDVLARAAVARAWKDNT